MAQSEIGQSGAVQQQMQRPQAENVQQEHHLPAYSLQLRTDSSNLFLPSTEFALKAITLQWGKEDENLSLVRNRCLSVFSESNSTNLGATINASDAQFERSLENNLRNARENNFFRFVEMVVSSIKFGEIGQQNNNALQENFMSVALKLAAYMQFSGSGMKQEEYEGFARDFFARQNVSNLPISSESVRTLLNRLMEDNRDLFPPAIMDGRAGILQSLVPEFNHSKSRDLLLAENLMPSALMLLDILNSADAGIDKDTYIAYAKDFFSRGSLQGNIDAAAKMHRMLVDFLKTFSKDFFPMQAQINLATRFLDAAIKDSERALLGSENLIVHLTEYEKLSARMQELPEASEARNSLRIQLQQAETQILKEIPLLYPPSMHPDDIDILSSFITLHSQEPAVRKYVLERKPHEAFFSLYKQHYQIYLATESAGLIESGMRTSNTLLVPVVAALRSYGKECREFAQNSKIIEFASGCLSRLVSHSNLVNALDPAHTWIERTLTTKPAIHSALQLAGCNTYETFLYGHGEARLNELIVAICATEGMQEQGLESLKKYGVVESLMKRAATRPPLNTDSWTASSKRYSLMGLEALCWIYGSKLLPLFPSYDLKGQLSQSEMGQLKELGITNVELDLSSNFGSGLGFLVKNLGSNTDFFMKASGGPWQKQSLYALFATADNAQKEEIFSAMKTVKFEDTYARFVEQGESDALLNEIFRQYQLWESKKR